MRPHVQVNCAITLDGCLGAPGPAPLAISNEEDRRRVHQLRASVDAILVGVGTVVADDPKLTVKWDLTGSKGVNPLRVVLDPNLRAPAAALVFTEEARTLTFCGPGARNVPSRSVERVGIDTHGGLDLEEVLRRLAARGVRRLMVEGGARTLTRFFAQDQVDRATLFISPRILGAPDAPRLVAEPRDLRSTLRIASAAPLGDGVLVTMERR